MKAPVLGARYLNFWDITMRRLNFRDKPIVLVCTKSIRTSLNQKENEKNKTIHTTHRESCPVLLYKCYSKLLPPSIYIGPNAFFDANFDQILEQ